MLWPSDFKHSLMKCIAQRTAVLKHFFISCRTLSSNKSFWGEPNMLNRQMGAFLWADDCPSHTPSPLQAIYHSISSSLLELRWIRWIRWIHYMKTCMLSLFSFYWGGGKSRGEHFLLFFYFLQFSERILFSIKICS